MRVVVAMLMTVLVLGFTLVAALTDLRWHKIYNWTTYPGMLIALAVNAVGTLTGLADPPDQMWSRWIGWTGLPDSVAGFLACGCLMVVLSVFFQVGGGDVKLLAMLGAFLGLEQGIETLLWTFVLGAAAGLIVLIWRVGIGTLIVRCFRHLWTTLRFGYLSRLTEEERKELQTPLFLASTAIVALVIVRFKLLEYLPFQI